MQVSHGCTEPDRDDRGDRRTMACGVDATGMPVILRNMLHLLRALVYTNAPASQMLYRAHDRRGSILVVILSYIRSHKLRIHRLRQVSDPEVQMTKQMFQLEIKRQKQMVHVSNVITAKPRGHPAPSEEVQAMRKAIMAAATPMTWNMRKRHKTQ